MERKFKNQTAQTEFLESLRCPRTDRSFYRKAVFMESVLWGICLENSTFRNYFAFSAKNKKSKTLDRLLETP